MTALRFCGRRGVPRLSTPTPQQLFLSMLTVPSPSDSVSSTAARSSPALTPFSAPAPWALRCTRRSRRTWPPTRRSTSLPALPSRASRQVPSSTSKCTSACLRRTAILTTLQFPVVERVKRTSAAPPATTTKSVAQPKGADKDTGSVAAEKKQK